jgi:hypothetical protein
MTRSRGTNPNRGLRGTALARFWQQVDTSPGMYGCWEWLGARTAPGYGAFASDDGDVTAAHRFALELTLGRPLGPGECACHHCDNRGCVNPLHLFAGSRTDNNRDMCRKGRCRHSEHQETK